MAEERRGARGTSSGGRPQGRGGKDRATSGGSKGGSRGGAGGGARSGGSGRRSDWQRPDDKRDVPRTVEQSVYDGPELPEEITGGELDRKSVV